MSLLQTDRTDEAGLWRRRRVASATPAPQNVDADVAIVGGGLNSLSAAIELADRGYSVVLREARQSRLGRPKRKRRP